MLGDDIKKFLQHVALGRYSNIATWSKTGFNGSVGIAGADIWSYGGTITYPASARRLRVFSDAGGDTAAGTGVQQVYIKYLDGSWVEKSEIVTMNGAGAVNTVAADLYRVQNFRAYRTGSTGIAAGNIYLTDITYPGLGYIYSHIARGYTRARNSAWTVPIGKTLFLTSAVLSSGSNAANKSVLMTVRATYDDATGRVVAPAFVTNAFFMPYCETLVQDGNFYRPFEEPAMLPACVDLKVAAVSDSDGARCSSILRGFVVTGSYAKI